MENNNYSPEEMNAEDTSSQAPEEEQEDQEAQRKVNQRSYIIWLIAGGYLVYLAYQLCKSVIDKTEGTGPIFIVAGVAFGAIGLFLCYLGVRGLIRVNKEKQAETEEAEAKAVEERKKNPNPESTSASMSLSDKANLVSRLGADYDGAEEEETEGEEDRSL